MSLHKILKVIFGRVMFTLLCIFVQILWMISLWTAFSEYSVLCSAILETIAVIVVIRINSRSEYSAARLLWTAVILAIPAFGLCLYSMFGRRGITRTVKRRYDQVHRTFIPHLLPKKDVLTNLKEQNIYIHNQLKYIQTSSTFPVYENTSVKYFPLADEALVSMLEDLRNAKEFIFMEYFAIEDAESWHMIEEILLEKIAQGVEVRLIYDDFGSIAFVKPEFMKRMNKKGIKCRVFNPLVPFVYAFMNHRDHRKIMVIDNKISYSGGFNMADEYFNMDSPYGHWKDSGIRMEGDGVKSHTIMFLQMWNNILQTDKDYTPFLKPYTHKVENSCGYVQPYSDTPLDNNTLGENVYMNIIKNATDYVYITTPYLILDTEMEKELCMAAQRGIDVRIITPNIPDKKSIFLLTQSYYNKLIRSGVRIYQYTPGFMHAKNYVCDDKIGIVGTINMDYRSLYLHFECATYLYDMKAVLDIKNDFEDTLIKCREITLEDCLRRKLHVKIYQAVLRLIAPMV